MNFKIDFSKCQTVAQVTLQEAKLLETLDSLVGQGKISRNEGNDLSVKIFNQATVAHNAATLKELNYDLLGGQDLQTVINKIKNDQATQ